MALHSGVLVAKSDTVYFIVWLLAYWIKQLRLAGY